jgi:hypothetical protein
MKMNTPSLPLTGSFTRRAALAAAAALGFTGRAFAQPPQAGPWTILHAAYGTAERAIDVTDRLRERARRELRVRVANDTFGEDPAPGVPKLLRIHARNPQALVQVFEYAENSDVDGTRFAGWSSGVWGSGAAGALPQRQYRILAAYWGTPEKHVDVTQRLRELARNDDRFNLDGQTFGADPDYGRVKTLRIHAQRWGEPPKVFDIAEGNDVDTTPFAGSGNAWGQGGGWNGGWNGGGPQAMGPQRPAGPQYRIVAALYGTPERYIDVTARLAELARRDGSPWLRLDNSTFGEDPAYGRVKTLRVHTRAVDGTLRSFDFGENTVVDSSPFADWSGGSWGSGNTSRGYGWNGRARLTIVSATYGSGGRQMDMRSRLQRRMADDQIDVRADNALAGRDPAPGLPKQLVVRYSLDGGPPRTHTVAENQRLVLP